MFFKVRPRNALRFMRGAMFGYVKPKKSEMKIREYDTYRAAYCGLCRAMKETTGQLSRLVLNYDFVFLCLVRAVLEKEALTVSYHRCPVHPLKKRPMLDITPSLCFCSSATLELTYCKVQDDFHDSSRGKKILCGIVFPFFKYLKKRSSLSELEKKINEHLCTLTELEKRHEPSVDMPASVFGELLGEVFSYGLCGSELLLAREIGYHTGRFVYVSDAADDYEKDKKSGNYNPIRELYGDALSEENRKGIKTALLCELSELERAVELLDFSDHRDIEGIIKNIIYLGMPEVMDSALLPKNNTSNRLRKDVNIK